MSRYEYVNGEQASQSEETCQSVMSLRTEFLLIENECLCE